MDFEESLKNGQISPTLIFDGFRPFLRFFLKRKKASLGLKKLFYLALSFIGRIFVEKMDFEESLKNGQISPTLIFDGFRPFLRFFLKRKKASLGLKKLFYLALSFIGRIFLAKMHGAFSPGRITRFQCSPGRITDHAQKSF